jgi:hypothetical protein
MRDYLLLQRILENPSRDEQASGKTAQAKAKAAGQVEDERWPLELHGKEAQHQDTQEELDYPPRFPL